MILKVQQFKHESESWKRMLEFMQQENVHLKTRLAEVLKKDVKDDFLEKAEYFQTGFLHLDERISFLRRDIAELNRIFLSELFHDGYLKELAQKQNRLRKDVESEEKNFNKLKGDFNNYLTEVL
jgi:hypothetical protein